MNSLSRVCVVLALLIPGCVSDDDGTPGVADSGSAARADSALPLPSPDAAIGVSADAAIGVSTDAGGGGLPSLACTLEEVTPLLTCASENCVEDLGTPGITTCLLLNCGTTVLGLSAECSSCVLTAVADSSTALDACVSGTGGLGIPMFP